MNIIEEYKSEIKRLQLERNFYRDLAIDEVADHHKVARRVAMIDVDTELLKHLNNGCTLGASFYRRDGVLVDKNIEL